MQSTVIFHNVWRVATAVVFMVLTSFANAQMFYVSEGPSGLVAKVTDGGTTSTFANIGGSAQGITTDSIGNVYVASSSSIYKITPGGTSTLYATYASSIGGISMSSTGLIYGISTGTRNAGIFNSDGTFTPLTLTTSPSQPFYASQSLKFDNAGNIFITNISNGGTFGESVLKLTPNGSSWNITSFVSYTTGSFQPYDLATDLSGNVFVTSGKTGVGTIVKYTASGEVDTSFVLSGMPASITLRGLTYANDMLYAVSLGYSNVYEIDPLTGTASIFQTGFLPDHRNTFITYSAVPEPSQVALIVAGGLVLLFCHRMRRNSVRPSRLQA